MKTAEEVLKEIGCISDFTSNDKPIYSTENALKAMRIYAEQEIEKHLEIAANESYTKYKYGYVVVDEESITGIKIELT